MADSILGSVVAAVVSKVIAVASDLVTAFASDQVIAVGSDQFNVALGWEEELEKFHRTMMKLRGFLQDAHEKNVSGHLDLKSWLQDLRDIADEADDILEEVAYEGMRPEVKKSKAFDLHALLFRQKMANRVEDLNKRLADINSTAHQLGLQHKLANMLPELRGRAGRETHSFLSSQVYGREEDVSKIVRLLVDSSSQHDLPVMIIVGMAGLGKTTIAKAVFKNGEIQEQFGDNRAWVCVSENFDVKKILMEILNSCGGSRSADRDFGSTDLVMGEIQKKLREKNYLLILDDVWSEERQMWEDLRDCLLGISEYKESWCKVLVTTRLENVASLMALSDEHIHRPRQLNEDECWSIIKQRAFGDNSVPEGLQGIGKQIAKRCKGIPLVASIIGAILQKKRDKREWQAIIENRVWDSLEKEGISDIIKFSYDHLPTLALKQCFAFCSIFPKGFVMEREMLIQLWMALGFLESPEEISNMAAEDVGDKYFRYLLSYYLFQEERRDNVTGSVESCKMHDLIHDFAQSISKSETLIVEKWLGSNISHDVRHLNLIGGRKMVSTIVGDVAKKLQTLFSKHGFSSGVQVDLKRLRVLSLDGASDVKQLPTCFGNLKRLRYLDISRTQMKELPEFISKLYNLQTFRFIGCISLQMPPGGIGDLINLRHICFSDEERMPANLGRLTNLQTLPLFFVGTTEGHKIEELGSLRELKGRLEIHKLELVMGKSEAEAAKLKEKAVDVLKLCWRKEGNCDEDVLEGLQPHSNIRILSIEGYGGRKLASWMLLLNSLVDLTITCCKMLHRIPNVNGFYSLQRLHVSFCDELTSLGDGDGAFTSLKQLYLQRCPKLKFIPSLEGLVSLKTVYVKDCDELECLPSGLSSCTALEFIPSLEGFVSLKTVNVKDCDELERLPSGISSCTALEFIPSLEGLISLKTLNVKDCDELERLPSGLSSCTALERLPSGLSSCTALEVLWITRCSNLVFIPEELKQLQSLVELVFGNCPKLKFIPSLEGLVFLKKVSIIHCDELERLLGGLSYCTALEKLWITRCSNLVSIAEELKQLKSLVELVFRNCPKLKFIPNLEGLVSLKTVNIANCDELEHLPGGLSSCTALEKLWITRCSNLVSIPEELKQLQSLVKLDIWECRKLRSFPEEILGSLSSLKTLGLGLFSEELEEFPDLSSTSSLEVLRLEGWGESVTLPRQIHRLTALRNLTITSINGVEEALLENLSCLKTLEIQNCCRLGCLSGGLSSVEELVIANCPNLVSFQGEFKELRSLRISSYPKLGCFLEESLACCTRLKRLWIDRFSDELEEFPSLSSIPASLEDLTLTGWEKLTHLPEIQHLTALKKLSIRDFGGMESLPDWFNNLSSLRLLSIWDCTNKLKERCTKGSGPDWHKISHVPYIRIDRKVVQFQSKH
ncbi:hypothetical protein SLEP1_g18609 [Rubroshorea leprosula]|uniref:Uncharacterized protein n=1 Tax=Rubroshorea leprosula TaxID=152421 RepID=A0AAV5J8N8_9ROSI|nr:hypothetical protein SLEP1_g18609 [Rubroshorea leprosula]